MVRVLFLVSALCALGSYAEKKKQVPASTEMAALQTEDPQSYGAVRRLLLRQRMGLLSQGIRAKAKLTLEQEQSFQSSNAMKDREGVLSLERQMMAERKQWAEAADSKYAHLTKRLAEEEKKPEEKSERKRLSALRVSASTQDVEMSYGIHRLPKRSGAARDVSWEAMKMATRKLRDGKNYRNSPADGSWGDMLKRFSHARKPQEEPAQLASVSGPLSSFSWGDQLWVAKHGPAQHAAKRELAMVAQTRALQLPDSMDMPDELDGFLFGGKSAEKPKVEKKASNNRYLMDLNLKN